MTHNPGTPSCLADAEAAALARLEALYSDDLREALAVCRLLMEEATGWPRYKRALQRQAPLPNGGWQRLDRALVALEQGQPLAYAMGWAAFDGLRLQLGAGVLVPRPETEELLHYACRLPLPATGTAMDVGTGSGALALAWQSRHPTWEVWAADASVPALRTALANARRLQLPVTVWRHDLLRQSSDALPQLDLILSNPPYVPSQEGATMAPHVVGQEPPWALFPTEQDPLRFYRALAELAIARLRPGGWLALEGHVDTLPAAANCYPSGRFEQVQVLDDLSGRPRFLLARLRPV